ncbi:MAG TPA: DUF6504 family protein [Kineosporiaceae bacterium]
MVRRYAEPVQVRAKGTDGTASVEPPASFLWRGRLYVVRAVLGHWRERRSWWTEAAARAVHGDDAGGASGDALAGAGQPASLSDEREVWRVEAGSGRAFGLGVYDLCLDPGRAWSLVRVSD